MKAKYILKGLLVTILLTLTVVSCGYDEAVIEELAIDREFAPVALTARVRNQTNVELNWDGAISSKEIQMIFDDFGKNLGSFLSPILLDFKTDTLILGGNIVLKTNKIRFFINNLHF